MAIALASERSANTAMILMSRVFEFSENFNFPWNP